VLDCRETAYATHHPAGLLEPRRHTRTPDCMGEKSNLEACGGGAGPSYTARLLILLLKPHDTLTGRTTIVLPVFIVQVFQLLTGGRNIVYSWGDLLRVGHWEENCIDLLLHVCCWYLHLRLRCFTFIVLFVTLLHLIWVVVIYT